MDWYKERVKILGMFVSSELFMLTDRSLDYKNTMDFVDRRIENLRNIENDPSMAFGESFDIAKNCILEMFNPSVASEEFTDIREEVKQQNPQNESFTNDNSNIPNNNSQKENDLTSQLNMRRKQAEENFEKIAKSAQDSINNLQGKLGAQPEELNKAITDLRKRLDITVQSTQEIWQLYGLDLNSWAQNQEEATVITKNIANITTNTQKAMQHISAKVISDLSNLDLQNKSFEENSFILRNTTENNLNELRDTLKSGISEAQSQFYEDSNQDLNENLSEDQSKDSNFEQKNDMNNEKTQETTTSSSDESSSDESSSDEKNKK